MPYENARPHHPVSVTIVRATIEAADEITLLDYLEKVQQYAQHLYGEQFPIARDARTLRDNLDLTNSTTVNLTRRHLMKIADWIADRGGLDAMRVPS